jgi:hypothetical protein
MMEHAESCASCHDLMTFFQKVTAAAAVGKALPPIHAPANGVQHGA